MATAAMLPCSGFQLLFNINYVNVVPLEAPRVNQSGRLPLVASPPTGHPAASPEGREEVGWEQDGAGGQTAC